jgi:hypothetical protein
MHGSLTSACNVRSDLQRAKEFALRSDLPRALTFNIGAGQGRGRLEPGSKRRTRFFLTFRGDTLHEGGGDGGVDDLDVAYEYLSGGLEVQFSEGAVVGRLAFGRRDREVVDRVGSSDRSALMVFSSGSWGSVAPKRRKPATD